MQMSFNRKEGVNKRRNSFAILSETGKQNRGESRKI
jgi:hypothetical protein